MRNTDGLHKRGIVQHAATSPYRFGALRAIAASLLSVSLLMGSAAWGVYQDLANQVSSSALDISGLGAVTTPTASTEDDADPLPTDAFEGRALNILVSGVDSRYNQDSEGYGDAEELSTIQSDTTMIAHISADRSRVQVISIPRDLVTDIPSCVLSDGSVTWEYEGMFNSAFSTGAVTNDLAGGVACTKAAAEQLTGLTIDAFVVVDFAGFKAMVDALGGVWFDPGEPVYDELAGLDLQAGCQLLNSYQALAYARARKDVDDGSDISRIGRQQKLVGAMMDTLLAKNFVTDLPTLLAFLKASISSLSVSPNLADINTAAGLLLSLSSLEKSNIQFVTMPNYPAPWDPNRVVENEYVTWDLWQALRDDLPLPVGIEYTDGGGNVLVVPDPAEVAAADAAASGAGETSADSPAQVSTDAMPASEQNAEATLAVSTCPPGR